MEVRDPSKKHFYISMIKSVVRILAGSALVVGNLIVAGVLFVGAEVLGILEEF